MNRSMDRAWLLADVFHDVDFAAARPFDLADVVAKHPECRPHALAFRYFDASLKTSIELGELARCLHAGGCIAPEDALRIAVAFTTRCDDQFSVVDLNV